MTTPRCKGSALLFSLLLFLNCGNAQAAGKVKLVKVFITCDGEDIPGARVCSALKEKIRASAGFELMQSITDADFCVHLISVDLGKENLSSAVAIVFTLPTSSRLNASARIELFETASVLRFGADRVGATADTVFADIDRESEFLRK